MKPDELRSITRKNGITAPPVRRLRAIAESMSVLSNSDGTFDVVSESGHYVVDPQEGTCSCPDAEKRGSNCKHQRRVAIETGQAKTEAWTAELGATALDVGREIERLEKQIRELKTAQRELNRLVDGVEEMAGQSSGIAPAGPEENQPAEKSQTKTTSGGVATGD
jgi:predicted nucleic acid-binding Zn finger protein